VCGEEKAVFCVEKIDLDVESKIWYTSIKK
jgi:hypothetical protein